MNNFNPVIWMKGLRALTAVLFAAVTVFSPAAGHAQATGLAVFVPPAPYVPVQIRALKVRENAPLVFDFVIDTGTSGLTGEALKAETNKLAKYFLAAMTIPENDLWVNLSPYEQDRIITDELGLTDLGHAMLAQDAVLKKMSSMIVDPSTPVGKEFWGKVYARAKELTGSTEVPMETLQKIWIIPETAQVYEVNNAAILGASRLKVMLDQDAVAQSQSESLSAAVSAQDARQARAASLEAMRSIVVPAIEKEVNEGRDFAPLRQLYGAIILASWYKKAVKDGLLAQVYSDQRKTPGIESDDAAARDRIYREYVDAFKTGAFNYIREDADAVTGEMIPRKYFTGGVKFEALEKEVLEVRPAARTMPPNVETDFAQGIKVLATVALMPYGVTIQARSVPYNAVNGRDFSQKVAGLPQAARVTGASVSDNSWWRTVLENAKAWLREHRPGASATSQTAALIVVSDASQNPALAAVEAKAVGGLNFSEPLMNIAVERSGKGVKVTIDPAMIAQMKADGVSGFKPVIINMIPAAGVLSEFGFKDTPQG
jgi:hypothetical protein